MIEETVQLLSYLFAFAFCIAAFFSNSRTYAILALSAVITVYINQYLSSDDPMLMQHYSSIEFFTCLSILAIGDIHKLYQSLMLFLMSFFHFLMEAALIVDNEVFIESGIYSFAITLFIVMQLAGAGHGLDRNRGLHWPFANRSKDNHIVSVDSKKHI